MIQYIVIDSYHGMPIGTRRKSTEWCYFNYIKLPLTIRRRRHYSTLNISETVQDGDNGIGKVTVNGIHSNDTELL